MAVTKASRIINLVTRIAQAIVCVVVIGLSVGFIRFYIKADEPVTKIAPFFYNVGMAAIALLFAVIWALPFASNFQNWWIDLFVAVVWAGALVWLWIFRNNLCGGKVVLGLERLYAEAKGSQGDVLNENYCSKLLVNNAFVIIGILLLLVTASVGFCAVKKSRGKGGKKGGKRRR